MNRNIGRQGGLNTLGIADVLAGIEAGRFSAADVVQSCLDRIEERDATVRAWAEVDREGALRRAREVRRDAGPLAGVPFGVKDVIDAAGLHTRMGSALYADYRPGFDAGTVAQLRMAGGIVLGKTETCEFAGLDAPPTTNPHNAKHTPGGSSSGSGAAVADFMVPFALGTQTGGSVLRPAAFCGVVGFKPSYGAYTMAGVKMAAPSFDTVGLLTRTVEDAALVHAALMAASPATARTSPPRIGLMRTHLWGTLEADAVAVFERTVERLSAAGAKVAEVAPPPGFETITGHRATISSYERARSLAGEWFGDRSRLRPFSAQFVSRGQQITDAQYQTACKAVADFRGRAATMLGEVDVLLSPVTPGAAPVGLENTGDPRLQELWTMLHLPSLALPAGRSAGGLPIGVQFIGGRFEDAGLLAAAGWAEAVLAPHRLGERA